MTRAFIGTIDGESCFKITADDADAPWSTLDSDVHKFPFNSNYQEIGYATKFASFQFDNSDITYPAGTPAQSYYPAGSNSTNWLWRRQSHLSGGTRFVYYFAAMDRLGFDPNAFHFVIPTFPAGSDFEWLYLWERRTGEYAGSSDRFYQSSQPWRYPIRPEWVASTTTWTLGNNSVLWQARRDGVPGVAWHQLNVPKFTIYQMDFPVDDSPYPAVVGTPAPGKKTVALTNTMARVAKPGFDVDTATTDQLIFGENKIPLKVIKAGAFTLTPGSTITIPLGISLAPDTLVDYLVNLTGDDLLIPPRPRGTGVDQVKVGYKISGSDLLFRNDSAASMDVRFIVQAKDALLPSTGSARVVERGDGVFTIRRPGSDGTQLADVIIDKRWPTPPVVAQGFVPYTSFVASDWAQIGSHMHEVTFSNPGFKPYPLAKRRVQKHTSPDGYTYHDLFSKRFEASSGNSASSFTALVTDASVKFYFNAPVGTTTAVEDIYRPGPVISYSDDRTAGFRYYILAVPASV